MRSKKITKGLYDNDCPWNSAFFGNDFLEKGFQRFPATATRMGKQLSVIKEISAEDLWYAKDEMPVRNPLHNFFAEPFTEFHYPLLVTGWTEVPGHRSGPVFQVSFCEKDRRGLFCGS
ncbi:MAG: hypothetical protein ABIL06_22810 [Pseudomonadota bacterium]